LILIHSNNYFALSKTIITFLIAYFVFAPLTAQNFSYIKYGLREGLPQAKVVDVVQDQQGYLWLATQGSGLLRFDGAAFDQFTTTDGLPSNFIQSLTLDHAGELWIGTNKGIAKKSLNQFQSVHSSFNKYISSIGFISPSELVIGTEQGLFVYNLKKNTISSLPWAISNINEIKALANGSLSIAASDGWILLRSVNDFKYIKSRDGLISENILSSTQQTNRGIWVAGEKKANLFNSNNIDKIYEYLTYDKRTISASYIDNKGNLWLGTEDEGIYIYGKNNDRHLSKGNGLPSNSIAKIMEDNLGQIWMAAFDGGLIKVLEQRFQFYNQSNGLPNNDINSLAEDIHGKLWMACGENGIASLDEGGITPYQRDRGFLNVNCSALCFDDQQRLWVGTSGKGIGVLDSLGLYQIIDTKRGLSGDQITSLIADLEGNIWIGTANKGLNYIKVNLIDSLQRQAIFQVEQTVEKGINHIQLGSDGNIWYSTSSGELGKIIGTQSPIIFNRQNGIPTSEIRSFIFDKKGGIWIGTAGEGLLYSEKVSGRLKFNKHPINPMLSSSNIFSLGIDSKEDLWIGNEKGVDRFSLEASKNQQVNFYGYTQGFLGGASNLNAQLLDRNGHLWFGTRGGLIAVKDDLPEQRTSAPTLSFNNIAIQNVPILASEYSDYYLPNKGIKTGLKLPWQVQQLSFQLKGIHLNYPEDIRYRWKLEGLENEWSALSKSDQINYSNLAAGAYEFKAEASHDGIHFSPAITSSFSISNPIWKETWFKWLVGILLSLLIFILFYSRIQSFRAKEKRKRKNLEIENELLNLNQKALQLQMNPHFIFNTLNSINALVAKGENQAARKQINNFAKQLRSTLSNSRKDFISLENEVKSLEEYLQMLQFCHAENFTFKVSIENSINSEEIELPPMIIQPFVENAVLHGFNGISKPGELLVNFSLQGKLLLCCIEDNGIGRKAAGISKARKPGAHQSAGMEVTKARLDNLKDGLNYKSLEIIDLYDDEVAIGTRVLVRIPFRVGY